MRNRSEDQIRLLLIRHGATQSNMEHKYLGRGDEGLSDEGIAALWEAKEAGDYPETDLLFASPMRRCLETAWLLYPERKPFIIPEWQEMDFGAFEGKDYRQLRNDARYQAWMDSGGSLPFPDGESREEFAARCERGFEHMLSVMEKELTNLCSGEERITTVGLIVHGGTIMALLSRYCGGEYFSYQTANGRGYVCRLLRDAGGIRLDTLGPLPQGAEGETV